MLTKKNQAQIGIWINTAKDLEENTRRNFKSISMDYMTPFGLEISIGVDNNAQSLSHRVKHQIFSYHFKKSP